MIVPTIGRIVLYQRTEDSPVLPAIVVRPHPIDAGAASGCVDVCVFSESGANFHPAIPLEQDEPLGVYPKCFWMDYQKGQAAKTEELEKKLAEKPTIAELESMLNSGCKVSLNPDGTINQPETGGEG
jgi:hypothetical protein